jgi:hypothetical protein
MRHLRLALSCLAAGFAINVAVAWTCAFNMPTSGFPWQHPTHIDTGHWSAFTPAPFGRPLNLDTESLHYGAGATCSRVSGRPADMINAATLIPRRDAPYYYAIIMEAGWPCRSFVGQAWQGSRATALLVGAIEVPHGTAFRLIPLAPRLTGSVINTISYAVVVATVLCGPRLARRLWRTKRNQCPHCAYPLGLSPRCPECGWRTSIAA